MKFLDSNILIYAADETQPDKYERACDIVEAAVRGNGFVVSAQVLNEFASVMYRKFKKSDAEVKCLVGGVPMKRGTSGGTGFVPSVSGGTRFVASALGKIAVVVTALAMANTALAADWTDANGKLRPLTHYGLYRLAWADVRRAR